MSFSKQSWASEMDADTLFKRLRSHYMEAFRAELEEMVREKGSDAVIVEPILEASPPDPDDMPIDDPVWAPTPPSFSRLDLAVANPNGQWFPHRVAPDDMLAFDPGEFELEGGLAVELESFAWDDAFVTVEPANAATTQAALDWFVREANEKKLPGPRPLNLVHALEPIGGGGFVIDLGTAHASALSRLLEAVEKAGAKTVKIGTLGDGPAL